MQKETRFERSLEKKPALKKLKELRQHPKTKKPVDTAPQHPHIEGERWAKTLVKQSVSRGRDLSRHLNKKK